MRYALLRATAISGLLAASSAAYGGEIYFTFNRNLNPPTASVFLFGTPGQGATISNLAGFSESVVLNNDGFFNLPIPSIYQQSGTGTRNTGFRVVSPDPIAGYFVNRGRATTDMTYLLDRNALGTNYVVASQGGGFGEGSQVAIHAVQDNTNVTFTPRGGAPIAVTLQAGETYKYAGGSANLTGSTVSASAAVAVFSGHECAQVPVGRVACDTLVEQMIPNDKLSETYLITASQVAASPGIGNDIFRVIATANGTEVKVDGAVVATLAAGETYEGVILGNTGRLIEASNPVAVAQYLIGQGSSSGVGTDPAMTLIPGLDTWLDEYRLATPAADQAFALNYASIVIPTASLGSLQLDGSAVDISGFTGIGSTGFSRGNVTLPIGLFDLTGSDPFLVMLGGGSNFDSYLTYGGSTFAPGISPPPPPPPPPPPDPQPVPAPAGFGLFGLGVLALAATRRKRRTA